jgi:FKBP-type peptidyl-prolyl cis-trans isomerase FkpA
MLFAALFALCCFGCQKEKKLTTPDGHEYIQHTDLGKEKPKPGDYVYFHAQIRDGERILRSSRQDGVAPVMQIPLTDEPGRELSPVESVIKLIGLGDSVTVLIELDSMQQQQMGITSGNIMYYDVVLTDIETEEERQSRLDVVRQRESEIAGKVGVTVQQYSAGQLAGEIKTTASGLKYIIHEEGSGDTPKPGNNVSVHYYGVLTDGTMFDTSFKNGEPISFPIGMGRVIPGWDEGIALLKPGGKATLFIPSQLGYGEQGSPPVIPPNAELIFYVEREK